MNFLLITWLLLNAWGQKGWASASFLGVGVCFRRGGGWGGRSPPPLPGLLMASKASSQPLTPHSSRAWSRGQQQSAVHIQALIPHARCWDTAHLFTAWEPCARAWTAAVGGQENSPAGLTCPIRRSSVRRVRTAEPPGESGCLSGRGLAEVLTGGVPAGGLTSLTTQDNILIPKLIHMHGWWQLMLN